MENTDVERRPTHINVHCWGSTFGEALERAAIALTDIVVDPADFVSQDDLRIFADGKDDVELVYSFLDEVLFAFDAKQFVVKSIEVKDTKPTTVEAVAHGKPFGNHPDKRRLDVKAITCSKVVRRDQRTDIYVSFKVGVPTRM